MHSCATPGNMDGGELEAGVAETHFKAGEMGATHSSTFDVKQHTTQQPAFTPQCRTIDEGVEMHDAVTAAATASNQAKLRRNTVAHIETSPFALHTRSDTFPGTSLGAINVSAGNTTTHPHASAATADPEATALSHSPSYSLFTPSSLSRLDPLARSTLPRASVKSHSLPVSDTEFKVYSPHNHHNNHAANQPNVQNSPVEMSVWASMH
ncbi:hypothetical protein BJ741DRAFT_580469 [Chytriomyces cf. hyalinus JEL632]|nr:hypothetical protein BJ741DRAFT_580469 [Chytriomyces cf. hyalinus JEL632]